MIKLQRPVAFAVLSPIFFILSLWISALPHEYAHSITAWLLGYKLGPFDIDYGSFDWRNVIFLDGIDKHVNYFLIHLFGAKNVIGLIAFAGPFIATSSLYFVSLRALRTPSVVGRPYLFYFCLWVNVTNLSELISYIGLRSISRHGDIGHIQFAWGVSQWLVLTVGCLWLSIATWHFFSRTLIVLYWIAGANRKPLKCFFLILFAVYLFVYPAAKVLLRNNDNFSRSISILFCVLTPVAVAACWPGRDWVRKCGAAIRHI
ncbi:conserved membrane hypothetical protein [Burkholderia sp. 8Y]|nr:conserved membrane hypothetical protein [Burkholderia sp. 8Y]